MLQRNEQVVLFVGGELLLDPLHEWRVGLGGEPAGHVVTGGGEVDDDAAAVASVGSPAHQPGPLEGVEHGGGRSRQDPELRGKLLDPDRAVGVTEDPEGTGLSGCHAQVSSFVGGEAAESADQLLHDGDDLRRRRGLCVVAACACHVDIVANRRYTS